jgi:Arc/MetJ family transcription regulator
MSRMVKKTIELDQDYIDKVRMIFRVRTDKEAVNKALELAIIDDEIIVAHERAGGRGELIDKVFE